MDQHERLNRTTSPQSVWSMAFSATIVEYDQFHYLFICWFINLVSLLEIVSYTDIISLINFVHVSQKAVFLPKITNKPVPVSTVNCLSGGDLSLYQLIKTTLATKKELISILLHTTTNLSCCLLKLSQTISLFFLWCFDIS